jgi:hypothetical protein
MYDYWGNEIRRFYQLETLSGAVDYMIAGGKDSFLVPSVRTALGEGAVTNLHFELFQEGRFQLIFRVRAANAKKKEGTFALVVAKNHQECSVVAKNEHRLLQTLHERAPDLVVKPYRTGKIYLPDRHGRRELGREIIAYVTQWLSGYEELGIDKSLQLIVNIKQRHVFTLAETEHLKGMMVEIIARSYSPADHTSMDIPEVASGDFVVRKGPKGKLSLKLIACRRMLNRMSPVRLMDKMLKASWPWGAETFRIAPESPETMRDALVRALGKVEALRWMSEYTAAVASGKVKNRQPVMVDAFKEYIANG